MVDLLQLDDLAFDLIFSHLRYIDLLQLSFTCRALRALVIRAPIETLNCTKLYETPVNLLPYAHDHCLLDQPDWRIMTYKHGRRRNDIYLTDLFWSSKHTRLNPLSLRNVILDGTRVNVLDVIYFTSASPHLSYLSVRFCSEIERIQLQNYLDTLCNYNRPLQLERLDVLGISGLDFFEPVNNGTYHFNEMEIELTGAGPEFDYQDRWREDMYDFQMSLERVPTTHRKVIRTDVARCSQSFCRNFDLGRKELADPTILDTLPACLICLEDWQLPICRACLSSRTCKICSTFICPTCYNNDNDIELHDYSTSQRWIQHITRDLARGGRIADRHCRVDIKTNCSNSPKAALMMQQTHRHMASVATATISLQEGYL